MYSLGHAQAKMLQLSMSAPCPPSLLLAGVDATEAPVYDGTTRREEPESLESLCGREPVSTGDSERTPPGGRHPR